SVRALPARHSMQWRLPLLLSGLLAIVLATFVGVAYHEIQLALGNAGGDRAQAAADQLTTLLTSFRQRQLDIRRVAAAPAIRAFLSAPSDQLPPEVDGQLRTLIGN